MAHHAPALATGFDETDPHGQAQHGQHESHVIVGPFILRTILLILLFFTALTVGIAQLEIAVQNWFGIYLPWWVNVVGAMSIATIKSILVMAYFMQLKYDNPINTVAMLFCFFALGLFLLFTGLDLFSRDKIYDFKAGPVISGGTGAGVITAGGKPIVDASRDRFMIQLAEPDIREAMITINALHHEVHEVSKVGTDAARQAAAVITARANFLSNLKNIMVTPPQAGELARSANYLRDRAAQFRSGGASSPVADLLEKSAQHIAAINLAEAAASYSVDATFSMLAAFAHSHGGHHGDDHAAGSTPDRSRSRSGRTDALELFGPGASAPPAAAN
jgi:cytochrome c oxidase subunit 4